MLNNYFGSRRKEFVNYSLMTFTQWVMVFASVFVSYFIRKKIIDWVQTSDQIMAYLLSE